MKIGDLVGGDAVDAAGGYFVTFNAKFIITISST